MKNTVNTIKKALLTIALAAAFISIPSARLEAKTNSLANYRKQARQIEQQYNLNVIDTSKLTYKAITHRKGTVIVERVIGKVITDQKDGRVLNQGANTEYNSISYRSVDCKKGDIIVTYVLYNPETNWDDDVLARWDYVLSKWMKQSGRAWNPSTIKETEMKQSNSKQTNQY